MKKVIIFCFFSIYSLSSLGQEGFLFEKNQDQVIIPFQIINNLIFIPIKVNGIELNFLLDTGVDTTLLFSMDEKKEFKFLNVEKIGLRGLGSEDAVEGLKSLNNTFEISGMKMTNNVLYVILDQGFNLSSHIGIPVNGIIGYSFFKGNLVEINYEKKKIIVYKEKRKIRERIKNKFQEIPITIEKYRPFVYGTVQIKKELIPVKLLIDIGNSDALWLFQNKSNQIVIPDKNFEDYLGKGFSGAIHGKRAEVEKLTLSKFEFNRLVIAFPDSVSVRNISSVKDRSGSIGSEILKRFTVVFDYPNQMIFVKKNHNFSEPFGYNKSGLEFQHYGLQWVPETVSLETVPLSGGTYSSNNFKYKFQLKPVYSISDVRKNSVAALCGLQKDDILVSINGISAYKFSLDKINAVLKSEQEKWITLEVQRESKILKFRFQLLNVL